MVSKVEEKKMALINQVVKDNFVFSVYITISNTACRIILVTKVTTNFFIKIDHILVITLIVKKDIKQRINVHLENVMKTTDFEAEEICSQSEASRGQKAFFFRVFQHFFI